MNNINYASQFDKTSLSVTDEAFNILCNFLYSKQYDLIKRETKNAFDFCKIENGKKYKHYGIIKNNEWALFYFCKIKLNERGYFENSVEIKKFQKDLESIFGEENVKNNGYHEVTVKIRNSIEAKKLINQFIELKKNQPIELTNKQFEIKPEIKPEIKETTQAQSKKENESFLTKFFILASVLLLFILFLA